MPMRVEDPSGGPPGPGPADPSAEAQPGAPGKKTAGGVGDNAALGCLGSLMDGCSGCDMSCMLILAATVGVGLHRWRTRRAAG